MSPWGSGATQTPASTTAWLAAPTVVEAQVEIARAALSPHKKLHRETSCNPSALEPKQAACHSPAHALIDKWPAAATSSLLRARAEHTSQRTYCMSKWGTEACSCGQRLACGTGHVHCTHSWRSRAQPPMLPRQSRSGCSRLRSRAGCCSATLEAFCFGPSFSTAA